MNTTKKLNFYESFIELVTSTFQNYGFIYHKSTKSFRKSFSLGEFIFEIDSLSNGIEVLPSFGLRIPLLDKILLKELYGLEKTTSSIPTIYWRGSHVIKNYDDIRLFITNEKELVNAELKVLSFFYNYALPHFERYSDLKNIDWLLNDSINEFDSSLHSTEWNTTLYLGLITAKLLNRTDYQAIESRNLQKIQQARRDKIESNMIRFNRIEFEKYRAQFRDMGESI